VPCDSQRAVPSSLELTSEIAKKRTCKAESSLVLSTSDMAGIDAIYRFTATASVLAKGCFRQFLLYLVLHRQKIGKAAHETKEAVVNRAQSLLKNGHLTSVIGATTVDLLAP
jgi:hypothetical protein